MEIITVWFNGNAMSVRKEIAEHHGLKNGETLINETKSWEVLEDDCKAGIFECQTKLALQERAKSQNG